MPTRDLLEIFWRRDHDELMQVRMTNETLLEGSKFFDKTPKGFHAIAEEEAKSSRGGAAEV
jgi:hypothetical protein